MAGFLILTDFEKLSIILVISIVFMLICLSLFLLYRKFRKDSFVNDPEDLIKDSDVNRDLTFNKKYFLELINLISQNTINNSLFNKILQNRKKLNVDNLKSLSDIFTFIREISDKDLMLVLSNTGYLYLFFLQLMFKTFLVLSVISLIIVLPINVYNDPNISLRSLNLEQELLKDYRDKNLYNNSMNMTFSKFLENQNLTLNNNATHTNKTKLDFLQSLTVKNAFNNDGKIYLILMISYIYTFIAYYSIYSFKKKVSKIKFYSYLREKMAIEVQSRTIHIREINKNLSFNEAKRMLDDYFSIHFKDKVLAIQVVPNYDKIISLLDTRYYFESTLNKIKYRNSIQFERTKHEINGYEVDYEFYLNQELNIIEKMILFYGNQLARKTTGNAFVCFKEKSFAKQVMKNIKKQIKNHEETFHGSILNMSSWEVQSAPTPSDLIWENVKYTKKGRIIKTILFTSILFFVFFFVLTPKFLFIKLKPLIEWICSAMPNVVGKILLEYSYSLIIVTVNSGILPIVTYYLALYEKHYRRSYREKSILIKTFVFLAINSFIIPSFKTEEISLMFDKILDLNV